MQKLQEFERECSCSQEYGEYNEAGIDDFVEMIDLKWQGCSSLDAKNLSEAGFYRDYQGMKTLAIYLRKFLFTASLNTPFHNGYKTAVVSQLSQYGLRGDAPRIINTIDTILTKRLYFDNISRDIKAVVSNIEDLMDLQEWNPEALALVVAHRTDISYVGEIEGHSIKEENSKAYQLLIDGKKEKFEDTYVMSKN